MRKIKFSIITVTLNAEKELPITIKSILEQTYSCFEVIIKDGMSKDKTLELIPIDERFSVVSKEDKSVYDGMNQAIEEATGDFVIFMNAGDVFYNSEVLKDIVTYIECNNISDPCVLYGNYCRSGEYVQNQKQKLDDFLLYRRPLCHQSMIYHKELFNTYGTYNTEYKISADHDLTLRLWFKKIQFYHTGLVICQYVGGGISETEKGITLAREEKKKILKSCYSPTTRFRYNFIIAMSFSGFRAWLDSKNSPAVLRNAYRGLRNRLLK